MTDTAPTETTAPPSSAPAEAPQTPEASPSSETGLEAALKILGERRAAREVPAAPAPAKPPEAPKQADEAVLLAKAQRDKLAQDRELRETKRQLQDVQSKARFAELLEKGAAKEITKLLQQRGLTMDKLAQAVMDEPEPDPVLQQVKQLEERVAKAESEKHELEQARVFHENVNYVSNLLKEQGEKYPAAAAFERTPRVIVERFKAYVEQHGEAPDVHELLKAHNEAVTKDLHGILASENALRSVLERPEIRERALSILGVKPSAGPASSQGANSQSKGALTAIPKTAAAEGARKAPPRDQDDRLADAMALLDQRRRERSSSR
jgi:hypothetical protein